MSRLGGAWLRFRFSPLRPRRIRSDRDRSRHSTTRRFAMAVNGFAWVCFSPRGLKTAHFAGVLTIALALFRRRRAIKRAGVTPNPSAVRFAPDRRGGLASFSRIDLRGQLLSGFVGFCRVTMIPKRRRIRRADDVVWPARHGAFLAEAQRPLPLRRALRGAITFAQLPPRKPPPADESEAQFFYFSRRGVARCAHESASRDLHAVRPCEVRCDSQD